MKQASLVFLVSVLLSSCSDTYVNHKLEFTKLGVCEGMSAEVQMESNIAGDRYVFNECLPDNFSEKGYAVDRKGDTLIVRFPNPDNRPTSGYSVTLDIDANPRYTSIVVGDRVLTVGEAQP